MALKLKSVGMHFRSGKAHTIRLAGTDFGNVEKITIADTKAQFDPRELTKSNDATFPRGKFAVEANGRKVRFLTTPTARDLEDDRGDGTLTITLTPLPSVTPPPPPADLVQEIPSIYTP